MDANKAISRIKFMLDVGGSDGFTSAEKEALNMAINALSAESSAPPKTNADRIRQMTDEELSVFLGGIADNCSYNTCDNCPMYGACVDVPLSRDKWLKQEASEEIDKQPTIKPEVRHGRWETWGYVFHGIEWKRCSCCGKCADVSYYGLLDGEIRMSTPAICGCCGARMDATDTNVGGKGGADNG